VMFDSACLPVTARLLDPASRHSLASRTRSPVSSLRPRPGNWNAPAATEALMRCDTPSRHPHGRPEIRPSRNRPGAASGHGICCGEDPSVLYPLTTFLSAFLLFQIQPMIARAILPWFGGSAALWTVAVLFFQLGLLAAYAYAHVVLQGISGGRQRLVHAGVLGASLLALPVAPSDALKPVGNANPVLGVLVVLLVSIGLPYFMLAASAPILQGWYAEESEATGARRWLPSPYVLYAISNTGSLLALLSYPFAVEPMLGLRRQFGVWSAGYAVFALALAALAWTGWRRTRAARRAEPAVLSNPEAPLGAPTPPSTMSLLAALGMTAATNTLLLAVTTALSHNIAPVPLLWVVPLGLYLLSFALPFGLSMRRLRLVLPFLAVLTLVPIAHVLTVTGKTALSMRLALLILPFFAICLACHVELAALRPHPRFLSSFYVMIALGGALGGVFAGVIAPLVFDSDHELPLSLGVSAAMAVFLLSRARGWSWWNPLLLVPLLAAAAGAVYIARERHDLADARLAARNFYGTLVVRDEPASGDNGALRVLLNGSIQHGAQLLDPARRRQPTTYYGPESGVWRALHAAQGGGPVRVGVIGLGTGTLAAYGRPGDTFVFFEINPLVVELAFSEFTFIRDSKARVEIVPGDARLSLERRHGPPFDVLVVDAFTGDSIPVHLLTREAFALYFRRLTASGMVALHISNKYVDLEPVARAAAESLGKRALVISTDDGDFPFYGSTWILLGGRPGLFETADFKEAGEDLSETPVAWTDDYSNLLSVLKR